MLSLEDVMHESIALSFLCCEAVSNLHFNLHNLHVSTTHIVVWCSASVNVLKYDTQKGSTEALGVASLYIAAYNLLFHKNEFVKIRKKIIISIKLHSISYIECSTPNLIKWSNLHN